MKPRYRGIAFVLLIVFVLLAGLFLKTLAQDKAIAATDKKVTSVEFKPGDAAQLALLRVQLNEVNGQISRILESYKMEGAEIVVDARGNWTGLKMPEPKPEKSTPKP